MTDLEKFKDVAIRRLKWLSLCLGNGRATFSFYRFEGLPYDVEVALTHLIESMDHCRRLVDAHINVYESDPDPES